MIRDFPGDRPDSFQRSAPIMASKGTCKADSCDKEVRAKGYCDRHYRKWRKGAMGKPRHRACNENDCGKAPYRRGLCEEHYAKHFSKKVAEPAAEAPAAEGAEGAAEAAAE